MLIGDLSRSGFPSPVMNFLGCWPFSDAEVSIVLPEAEDRRHVVLHPVSPKHGSRYST
jgi:hypothetical protein